MEFITDKQTLSDLNMLGKYKAGSLFNLFNRVKTRGGELLLEDMFRMPLTNADSINQRAACIQYVQALKLETVIDADISEMASQYIAESRPLNRFVSIIYCIKDKAQEIIYRSQNLNIQQKHILAVHKLLQSAGYLLRQLNQKGKLINPCLTMQQRISEIVNIPQLQQVVLHPPESVLKIAECQYLFRNKYKYLLEELLILMYTFDVYISVAEVASEKEMVFSQAEQGNENNLMEAGNLRHPCLPNAVGNTLSLSRDQNMIFLTGANMAGKSTWMKTLGISFYLGHMGFPVSATNMRFTVMEGIFTSINVPDDLTQGWSHFYSEVMRVKLVAEKVSTGKKLFILFDELFKGTNVKDAFDATLVVSQKLAKYTTCTFVVSTHIIEVGKELMNEPNIQFQFMPTIMVNKVPHYNYELKQGITSDRQGMIIIENEGILNLLKL